MASAEPATTPTTLSLADLVAQLRAESKRLGGQARRTVRAAAELENALREPTLSAALDDLGIRFHIEE